MGTKSKPVLTADRLVPTADRRPTTTTAWTQLSVFQIGEDDLLKSASTAETADRRPTTADWFSCKGPPLWIFFLRPKCGFPSRINGVNFHPARAGLFTAYNSQTAYILWHFVPQKGRLPSEAEAQKRAAGGCRRPHPAIGSWWQALGRPTTRTGFILVPTPRPNIYIYIY